MPPREQPQAQHRSGHKIPLDSLPEVLGSRYPTPFDAPCRLRRVKRVAEAGKLTRLGASLLRLPPGAWSSQRHWHALEDELLYVISGEVVVVSDSGEEPATPGDFFAWPAGVRDGHCVKNVGASDALLLTVSSNDDSDHGEYPDIDLKFTPQGYRHRDDTPYPPREEPR